MLNNIIHIQKLKGYIFPIYMRDLKIFIKYVQKERIQEPERLTQRKNGITFRLQCAGFQQYQTDKCGDVLYNGATILTSIVKYWKRVENRLQAVTMQEDGYVNLSD